MRKTMANDKQENRHFLAFCDPIGIMRCMWRPCHSGVGSLK